MNQRKCRLVVVGAGLVGERHARLVAENPDCELVAIIDPRQEIDGLALATNCERLDDLQDLAGHACDGVIIATPNHNHFKSAMLCLDRNLPCLIEKPITEDLASGERLVAAFEQAGVPLLVGHHRRYHPVIEHTRSLLASGEVGVPVCASMIWAVKKPDAYFKVGAWRLGADGGPIMINFIHEVDLMRCLFGEIAEVTAMASNHQRQTAIEDTAAVILRFERGLVATAILSDAALTPWSFEGAINENPNIAQTGVSSWRVGCSEGAFEFPLLRIWQNAGEGQGDWSRKLKSHTASLEAVVPLKLQLQHFVKLVKGEAQEPVVSGREGLNSLRAVRAIMHSAQIGEPVVLSAFEDCARPQIEKVN